MRLQLLLELDHDPHARHDHVNEQPRAATEQCRQRQELQYGHVNHGWHGTFSPERTGSQRRARSPRSGTIHPLVSGTFVVDSRRGRQPGWSQTVTGGTWPRAVVSQEDRTFGRRTYGDEATSRKARAVRERRGGHTRELILRDRLRSRASRSIAPFASTPAASSSIDP
jgi:hypothetical protein